MIVHGLDNMSKAVRERVEEIQRASRSKSHFEQNRIDVFEELKTVVKEEGSQGR